MEIPCSSGIDRADRCQVAQHRKDGWPIHVRIDIAWVAVLFGLHLKPSKNGMKDES